MSSGVCTNLPSLCSKAAQRTPLPADGPDARCSECGAALLRTEAKTAGGNSRTLRLGAAALAAALLLGGAGWWLLGRDAAKQPATLAAATGKPAPAPARSTADKSQMLRLHGSNTVGASFAPALLQAFLTQEGYDQIEQKAGKEAEESLYDAKRSKDGNELHVELHAHGSGTAFTDLRDGKTDVGMSSRPIKKEEVEFTQPLGDLAAEGSEYVIALDGLAVIVHPTNPVGKLSIAQIRGLYSGQINDWKDVGGKPGPVKRLARDDKSGTYDTFKALVLGKDKLAEGTQRLEDSAQLSDSVAADPQAIGFIGLPYVRQAKLLAVSDGEAAPLRPTRLTVATEDYALARRLFLYVPQNAAPLARRFADFAVSDAGQQVAEKIGFVGQLPDPVDAGAAASSTPADYQRVTDGAKRLSVNLRFKPGSMKLDNKGQQDLTRIVRQLETRLTSKQQQVMLLGFADAQGGTDACRNQRLSQERANAVATELATYGIKGRVVHGFGAAAPVASNETEAGRERNRRVEVWISDRAVQTPAAGSCG
ncbi:MAG: substrate-binding domain-containing protein [Leptothrix sp. (in: b-proteobacteria)]